MKSFIIWLIAFIVLCSLVVITIYRIHPQKRNTEQSITQNVTFSGLSVSGNKIINQQGQQVILHGVNRSGAEYSCVTGNTVFDGPSDAASIQAMRSWKSDVVRIPLNEDCWLGINGVKTGGFVYQQAIKKYVKLIHEQHMYVILELHWNAPGDEKATGQKKMADADHSLSFWSDIATSFKNNQTVIFDVYNEPHDISWNCWKDSTSGDCGDIAGMQQLLDAVRKTGAKNVIMAGGLDYARDLSHWLEYKPNDPTGNLVASWHMYGNKKCEETGICWNTSVISHLIDNVPVIAGEFGESPDGSVCGTNTINTFVQWLDERRTGYVAWTWDTWGTSCGNLSLITDYNGTPKSPNGVTVKDQYLKLGTTR